MASLLFAHRTRGVLDERFDGPAHRARAKPRRRGMRIGEELHRAFNDRARLLAVLVQGRIVYETMESFWPQTADDETTLPGFLREYGCIWTAAEGARLQCEARNRTPYAGHRPLPATPIVGPFECAEIGPRGVKARFRSIECARRNSQETRGPREKAPLRRGEPFSFAIRPPRALSCPRTGRPGKIRAP